MIVALYARVSTTKQAEKDLSIPDQIRQIKEWCEREGHGIAAEYIEEGASATDDRRQVFQRMINEACSGTHAFDCIVIHSLSRFFRDLYGFIFYEKKLNKAGVKIISITQPTGNDPAGEMLRKVISLFDEYQSKETAKHTLRAMMENARKGFFNGSTPPFGFKTEEVPIPGNRGMKKRPVIDPGEAEIVRKIFDLYLNGSKGQALGMYGVAQYLNEKGISYRGSCWNSGHVNELLKNPAYMYALLHTILYRKKAKSLAILMPFSQTLKSTADWYVQLLAESLGKKFHRKIQVDKNGLENWLADKDNLFNQGRTPISAAGTNDLHSIQQNNAEGENNKVVTFIRVEKFRTELKIPTGFNILSGKNFSGLMKLAQEATEWALVNQSRPNCTIIMPKVDAYNWGALLFFFEMATAFEGELQNVNAYDQPGVEGYKNYMYYKLGKPGIPQAVAEEIKNKPLIKNPEYIL